uniref:BPTI/Kunitz inhibitor domain-containing protein n=1 Tax=Globodera rostochiensis TaxID=31243 RepID=A0A914I531_GLORO
MLSRSTLTCVLALACILPVALAELDEIACGESRDKGNNECGESGGRRFYYDANTKRCQPFAYGGCAGNGNRFDSMAQCRQKCANFEPVQGNAGGGEEGHHMVLPVPKCSGGVRAAVDAADAHVIECPGEKCPEGYKCEGKNCCPAAKKIVCNIEYDTGRYAFQGSHTPRYFYKKEVDNCLLFTYYGALGNGNNFENYNDCIKYCKKA